MELPETLAHTMSADAIIVGAGPAGAVTAMLLGRAGFAVILLDRAAFPRDKPCGDCLSAGAGDVLRRLGLDHIVGALPAARLSGWRIAAPDGSQFTARFGERGGQTPPEALAIERRVLDNALLHAAIDAGATFVPETRVSDLLFAGDRVTGVIAGNMVFRAPLTIGADGLRSVVATRLGVVRRAPGLRKLSLTAHIETAAVHDDFGEMHVAAGLCVGVAPVTADRTRCNLTVVGDAAKFGRSVAADRHAFAIDAISAMPRLRGRIEPSALAGHRMLTSGPFDRPVGACVFDGAALVGDAAGYYDPFTGQGVFQALVSAEMLAAAAADALHARDVSAALLRPYQTARSRLMRWPRSIQFIIEQVLSRPRLASQVIRRIAAADAFGRALIDVTGDVAPVSRLFAVDALSSLISRKPEIVR